MMNQCEFKIVEVRDLFDLKLKNVLQDFFDLGQSGFFKCVMVAAKEVANAVAENDQGWF